MKKQRRGAREEKERGVWRGSKMASEILVIKEKEVEIRVREGGWKEKEKVERKGRKREKRVRSEKARWQVKG